MKYLVDSDYVADYLGAHSHAIQLLSSFAKDDLSISLITYGEIYEGIHFGRDPQKTTDVFQRFFRSVIILPPTQTIMQRFARIRGELRRKGNIIGDFDIPHRLNSDPASPYPPYPQHQGLSAYP